MPPVRSHTLLHGATAGLAAGAVVALWFLVVDLTQGQPFHTPALLASALVGQSEAATVRLVAMYTVLHFGTFALLGMATASLLLATGLAPSLLLGALFGIGVFDSVHYGALLVTGTGVLSVLPPLHVLPANLLGGLVMMAWLHRVEHWETPFGLGILREYPLWAKGLVSGLLGAGVVALWFLVLDILRGRPFYTPAALGSLVFLGATSPAGVQVSVGVVAAYTLLHLAAFAGAGVLLEWSAGRIERVPGMWLMALLMLIVLEGLFLGTAGSLSGWVLGDLGRWAIGIANLAAVAVMGAWVWASHPQLRHGLLDHPVQTRV